MKNLTVQYPEDWRDYELIDSGAGEKLERWGAFLISRPEPRAMWKKGNVDLWKKVDAKYVNDSWSYGSQPPKEWVVGYDRIKFLLKPTDFKHTGVFPEQAVNWKWLGKIIKPGMRILNLFAYTGGATLACAAYRAVVTHVDSSRPALMWASENAKLSKISSDTIRWIQDDALKFVRREFRRGVVYDGIIMDPPKFGRGVGGEIWKLEDKLPELAGECKRLLSPNPAFFLINAYTADLSALALGNMLSDFIDKEVEFGELGIKESSRDRIMPAGIFARWSI
jgi:23S rRNA (cytosine1962-C5)-methyltransferase